MKQHYVNRQQAIELTGFHPSNLRYHARRGNLRVVKQLLDDGVTFRYLFHIDDLRMMTWPGPFDVAREFGVRAKTLSVMVGRFNIDGAVKIGGRWRFPPELAERVGRWASLGYPVMKGITPK